MTERIDRAGEERVNKFGSIIVITRYNNKRDVDIYFPEYNWTFEHARYQNFKKGEIKCPYECRYYRVGIKKKEK